ncbi:hypothetical protein ACETRX_34675 [Labrys portucalensis]|uniref:Uncharacterized protein n=1 Tax=Labrys neptuniae TaxID=376174 RepID=A0ABV6ZRI3_9HYPH
MPLPENLLVGLTAVAVSDFQKLQVKRVAAMELETQRALAAGVPRATIDIVKRHVLEEAMSLPFWGSPHDIDSEITRRLRVLVAAAAR